MTIAEEMMLIQGGKNKKERDKILKDNQSWTFFRILNTILSVGPKSLLDPWRPMNNLDYQTKYQPVKKHTSTDWRQVN